MARKPEVDITREISVSTLESMANEAMYEIARCLRDTGWISEKNYDATRITNRARSTGKIGALRRPIISTSSHNPDFVVNLDALRSYAKEFQQYLGDHIDSQELIERLVATYSASVAFGEYAFRKAITDPAYARTPQRLAIISAIITDTSDFTAHFRQRLDDIHLKKLMENVDDSAVLEINGLRAGLTIVRSAFQEAFDGSDFITDNVVLSCNEALESLVHQSGPSYVNMAKYLNMSEDAGVGAFSYAIPEWLYVLAVPMSTATLAPIFDSRHLTEIGQPEEMNWFPNIVIDA